MKQIKNNLLMFFVLGCITMLLLSCDNSTSISSMRSGKLITSFSFAENVAAGLGSKVDATIQNTAIAVTVPSGVDLTKLVPTIVLSTGAQVDPPSGIVRDFSNPVTYTVTAEDSSTQMYTVTVQKTVEQVLWDDPISSFSFAENKEAKLQKMMNGIIQGTNIRVNLPLDVDRRKLVPSINLKDGFTIDPASGVTTDFSNPVTYTITATNGGATKKYTVAAYLMQYDDANERLSVGNFDDPVLFTGILEKHANIAATQQIRFVQKNDLENVAFVGPISDIDLDQNGKFSIGSAMTYEQWKGITAGMYHAEITIKKQDDASVLMQTVFLLQKTAPTEIYTWKDLQGMKHDLSLAYQLQNDIQFPEKDSLPPKGFSPIGPDRTNSFTGTFDGNNKTITALYINDVDQTYVGLFGRIEAEDRDTVVVQNLTLKNPEIKGKAMIGSVAGALIKGKMENVAVEGSSAIVESVGSLKLGNVSNAYIGGLVGYLAANASLKGNSAISVVAKDASVVGANSGSSPTATEISKGSTARIVGGLVGISYGAVEGEASGTITSERGPVGGLVGSMSGSAASLKGKFSGTVTATHGLYVGGLVGNVADTSKPIIGTNAGSVNGLGKVGGIAGVIARTVTIVGIHEEGEKGKEGEKGRVGTENTVSAAGVATGFGGLVGEIVGRTGENTLVIGIARSSVEGFSSDSRGGLVGQMNAPASVTAVSVKVYGYWDGNTKVTNKEKAVGVITDLTKKSPAEQEAIKKASLFVEYISAIKNVDYNAGAGSEYTDNRGTRVTDDDLTVFHHTEFKKYFELPSAEKAWPTLK